MRRASAWLGNEQALLGALLLDDAAFWRVADRVEATDFAGDGHAEIMGAIRELAGAGRPRDAVTITDLLTNRGLIERAGGRSYLLELANNAPGSANAVAYADLVVRAADHRRTVQAGQRIAALDMDSVGEAPAILSAAIKPKGSAIRSSAEVMVTWHAELTRRYEMKEEFTGAPTGVEQFDRMTGGMQDTDLIIVAARPSMGKTALMGQAMAHCARHTGPVLCFTLEMTAEQLINRMVSAAANVPVEALLNPKTIADDEWPRISEAAQGINGLPIYYDETPAINLTQLQAKARQMHAKARADHGGHGLRLIVADYLQIMTLRKPDDAVTSLKEITGGLKQIAKELKVPVLALSQLNRSVENRSDKRPMMSDLRDSGTIEQDADIVAFLYRDEYYNRDPDNPLKGYAELIVSKQRNGRTGTVPMKSMLQFCRFDYVESLPAIEVPTTNHPVAGRPFAPRRPAAWGKGSSNAHGGP